MKKLKLKKRILIVILFVFSFIFVFSLLNIIKWYQDNEKSKDMKDKIDEYTHIDPNKNTYDINFKELDKLNSDTIAYIIVNNTKISYPVVKTYDNDYYLRHGFDKNYSEAGWIFMDYKNQFDGTDKNIVIYGHGRLDGSMFGSLKKVLDEEWYSNKDNLTIRLITKKSKVIEYKIFSVYKIKEEEYYINTKFDDNSFDEFVKTIKKRSIHQYEENMSQVNQVLTLSTCTIVDGYRFVVHAYN